MRVLVGCVFGIGNSVLRVPLIRAMATLATVDLLIGSGPDDRGSDVVLSGLRSLGLVDRMHVDRAPLSIAYDVAVMAIPFDGRWIVGRDFNAVRVMDCRPRPDPTAPLGFESWHMHESEYGMQSARSLGFLGPTPTSSFDAHRTVYLGLGYKRDAAGFWRAKDWGHSRYAVMMIEARRLMPGIRFLSTGNARDWEVACPVMTLTDAVEQGLFRFTQTDLDSSIAMLRGCDAYTGNDTGMLHVAASSGLPCVALMAFPGTEVKNPPLGTGHVVRHLWDPATTPESVASDVVRQLRTIHACGPGPT